MNKMRLIQGNSLELSILEEERDQARKIALKALQLADALYDKLKEVIEERNKYYAELLDIELQLFEKNNPELF